MQDAPPPKVAYARVWLSLAGLALAAVALAAGLALWPRPEPAPVVVRPLEWRCAQQAKGGPICERPLPPAARPAPR